MEDDPTMLRSVERALGSIGVRVVAAREGLEAVALLRRGADAFDLVITDLLIPDISGAEVARLALRKNASLPVIVTSGLGEANPELLSNPRVHFLPKPFRFEALREAMRRALPERFGDDG